MGRVSPTAGVSPESLAGVALAAMGRAIDEAGALDAHRDAELHFNAKAAKRAKGKRGRV